MRKQRIRRLTFMWRARLTQYGRRPAERGLREFGNDRKGERAARWSDCDPRIRIALWHRVGPTIAVKRNMWEAGRSGSAFHERLPTSPEPLAFFPAPRAFLCASCGEAFVCL